MIIPSKQLLLITASDKKELFLFDPKTACVLYTFSTESTLMPTAAYFEEGQQILIPHLNNTFVNVWEADAGEPKKFSVGGEDKITSVVIGDGNILYMGSSNGVLYTFELPSGILIRKIQLHHSRDNEIKHIKILNSAHIITATRKEIKLWALKDLVDSQKKPIAIKTIPSNVEIIGLEIVRGIACLITQKNIEFYYAVNLEKFTLNRDVGSFTQISCSCSSNGSIFIGEVIGKIREIPIDAHEKELQFEERKGRMIQESKKISEIEVKEPICSIAFVESIGYLIVGNEKGEVKVWNGKTLKNSVQLFKSPISHIFVMQRPNKDIKIGQNLKIKSFHKQEKTKMDQPIYFNSADPQEITTDPSTEPSNEEYLVRMLSFLNDNSEQLESEIEGIRAENAELTATNLEYFNMLDLAK